MNRGNLLFVAGGILDAGVSILDSHFYDGAPQAMFSLGTDLVLVADGVTAGTTRVYVLPFATL